MYAYPFLDISFQNGRFGVQYGRSGSPDDSCVVFISIMIQYLIPMSTTIITSGWICGRKNFY